MVMTMMASNGANKIYSRALTSPATPFTRSSGKVATTACTVVVIFEACSEDKGEPSFLAPYTWSKKRRTFRGQIIYLFDYLSCWNDPYNVTQGHQGAVSSFGIGLFAIQDLCGVT
jgi:hypothetical protein